jgi:adenine-specific DNA-methyltransferase
LDPVAKWRQWEVDSPIRNVVPFFEYATASRGIATGANGYFCLSEEDRKQLGLGMERVIPCLTKAVQAVPPFFTAGDFERLRSVGHEVYLVDLVGGEADPAVAAYIRRGEELGVHERHLTSHRTPWYAVERRQPPDVLTGVFGRGGVKLVLNRAGVRSLSCFHGVWFREWVPAEVSRLLLAYLVTPVAAEVLLRNRREYGDGLIKFEPRDVATAQVVDVGTLVASDRPDILAAFDRYETGREAADLTLLDSFFRRHILSTTPTH